MRLVRISLVLGLVVAASACGGDDSSSDTTTPPSAGTTTPTTDPTSDTTDPTVTTAPTTPTTEPPAPTTEPTTPTTEPTTPTTEPPAPTTTAAPPPIDVKVYFLDGERLSMTHRDVPGPAVLRGALTELLVGVSADESATGLTTLIPAGTTLLDVNLAAGLATVDLSEEFDDGGGSLAMLARVAQVVFTATQFDNVEQVRFWMEGEQVDYLGGEGIVLVEPLGRIDIDRWFTGGIIFDMPAPGATVTSPFTVTGEGDVFEGDFPLVVRRDGNQLGDILVVRAGAWGTWDDFETMVTVDAEPGPIELVAVDDSGCGPPECPGPTEVVLQLELAG